MKSKDLLWSTDSFLNFFYSFLACWEKDPHLRPSFDEIISDLKEISQSAFVYQETFHTMQETWKVEINSMLHEMRKKEKVRFFRLPKVSRQSGNEILTNILSCFSFLLSALSLHLLSRGYLLMEFDVSFDVLLRLKIFTC
jgi:hypothetical protein